MFDSNTSTCFFNRKEILLFLAVVAPYIKQNCNLEVIYLKKIIFVIIALNTKKNDSQTILFFAIFVLFKYICFSCINEYLTTFIFHR